MEEDILNVDIALSETNREKISAFLQTLLASTFALFVKTQQFHWNVTGVQFPSFHLLFQDQYEELFIAIDEIAERIRALGFFPKASLSVFSHLSIIDSEERLLSAIEMLYQLLQDHEHMAKFLRENLPFTESCEDGATADFINKRLAAHEKAAWMLRSTLPQKH